MKALYRGIRLSLFTFIILVAGCDTPDVADADLSGGSEDLAATAGASGYRLVFEDNFNGRRGANIDGGKWSHRDTGPRRDAINTPKAVELDGNGNLVINTYTEGGKHYTGMIRTKKEWKYGRFEIRVKFNTSPGVFSDFWLQSRNIGEPVGNPSKAGVEIDVIEHRAVKNGKNISGRGNMALHWDGYDKHHKMKHKLSQDMNLGNGFHTLMLEWTPQYYRWYYDGKLMWEQRGPIADVPEYVILSSEIQSGNWAGRIPNGGYGSKSRSKTNMIVDYVRVYQKGGSGGGSSSGGGGNSGGGNNSGNSGTSSTSQSPFGGNPINLPGRIEAERFDKGGAGVAYRDANATNKASGRYRSGEGVDTNGDVVGWIRRGEWLEYTVNVDRAGTYDLKARVSSNQDGGRMEVGSLSNSSRSSVKVPGTGGWSKWRTITIPNVKLAAGRQVLRVDFKDGGFNLDYLELSGSGSGSSSGSGNASSSPSASSPSASGSGNLVKNGSFEDGRSGWRIWGAQANPVSNPSINQARAIKVTGRNQAYHSPVQDITRALKQNGEGRYVLEAFIRTMRPTDGAAAVVKIVDGSGERYITASEAGKKNGWQRLKSTVNLNWRGTLKRAYVYVSMENATTDYYLDGVSLRRTN